MFRRKLIALLYFLYLKYHVLKVRKGTIEAPFRLHDFLYFFN